MLVVLELDSVADFNHRLVRLSMVDRQGFDIFVRQAKGSFTLRLLVKVEIDKDVIGFKEHALVEDLSLCKDSH